MNWSPTKQLLLRTTVAVLATARLQNVRYVQVISRQNMRISNVARAVGVTVAVTNYSG